eukprot:Polyplicarium_translucidae@DN3102_c0_g1_i6.p4
MPVALGSVKLHGHNGSNWVFFRNRGTPTAERCAVIFFPGDVSSFAGMCAEYELSFEGLAWHLAPRFDDADFVLVCPFSVSNGFAHFSNFAAVDAFGNPVAAGSASRSAVLHLYSLLVALAPRVSSPDGMWTKIRIIGFSKSVVVLNRLLVELGETQRSGSDDATATSYLRAVLSDMHFLDPGLNVPGIFSVTSRQLSCAAQQLLPSFAIFVHVTPRQYADPTRPWIRSDCDDFLARARHAQLSVRLFEYFANQRPSLEMHFRIVRVFKC